MATHSSVLAWRIRGQRSLAGYSPWDHIEFYMTKQLTLFTQFHKLPRWLSGKESTCNAVDSQETWLQSLGQEDPLEKEMATHSNILAWEIPWTKEPGGLQSMGPQRVRCN